MTDRPAFPARGTAADAVIAALVDAEQDDVTDFAGRFCSGAVYPAGQEVYDLAVEAHHRFSTKSALIPRYWPSVRRLESEVVAMAADLLHGRDATGNVTTGGTESILLGVKIARDRARSLRPDLRDPEIVVPETAHPAFTKAGEYFGLRVVPVGLTGPDFHLDLDAYRAAISDRTVLLVGSAPNVFLGDVDPIEELSRLAVERDLALHVDACIGGFFLPFARRLGAPVPPFDFDLPGVTTISADLHKFGYVATKGASVILSRDPGIHRFQEFAYGPPNRAEGWFRTPTIPGTRTGGGIAAAWAVLRHLGMEGFLDRTRTVLSFMDTIRTRVAAIDGLSIVGAPAMSVFALAAQGYDIFDVAARLEADRYLVKRDTWPVRVIRFMQSPGHAPYVPAFLDALERACAEVAADGGRGQEADAAYV